jgi:hypothetical protein
MKRISLIPPEAPVHLYVPQNQHFQRFSELLILHGMKSRRINTYKIFQKSRIALIPDDFKFTTINTSGPKDLKSPRINTSGNKDLKSRRINTSEKHPGGGHRDQISLIFFQRLRRIAIAFVFPGLPAGGASPILAVFACLPVGRHGRVRRPIQLLLWLQRKVVRCQTPIGAIHPSRT